MKLIVIGVIILFGSIWITPYIINPLPHNHWMEFPIFATGYLLGVGGIGLIVLGGFRIETRRDQ